VRAKGLGWASREGCVARPGGQGPVSDDDDRCQKIMQDDSNQDLGADVEAGGGGEGPHGPRSLRAGVMRRHRSCEGLFLASLKSPRSEEKSGANVTFGGVGHVGFKKH
jgi:hypothetical protein